MLRELILHICLGEGAPRGPDAAAEGRRWPRAPSSPAAQQFANFTGDTDEIQLEIQRLLTLGWTPDRVARALRRAGWDPADFPEVLGGATGQAVAASAEDRLQ